MNIFSAEEAAPELHEAFSNQPQAGQQPTAPSTNPMLLAPHPVPLPAKLEQIARVNTQVNWKAMPIG